MRGAQQKHIRVREIHNLLTDLRQPRNVLVLQRHQHRRYSQSTHQLCFRFPQSRVQYSSLCFAHLGNSKLRDCHLTCPVLQTPEEGSRVSDGGALVDKPSRVGTNAKYKQCRLMRCWTNPRLFQTLHQQCRRRSNLIDHNLARQLQQRRFLQSVLLICVRISLMVVIYMYGLGMTQPRLTATNPRCVLCIHNANGMYVFGEYRFESTEGKEMLVEGQKPLDDRVHSPRKNHVRRQGRILVLPKERQRHGSRERVKVGIGMRKHYIAGLLFVMICLVRCRRRPTCAGRLFQRTHRDCGGVATTGPCFSQRD
mmetsp:Transcript_11112/g.16248  ORF Transcript_11112/g.16248 Transcript_11112/m.16248 type:complete len:310 (+) Transcript_11112:1278-2207(+)